MQRAVFLHRDGWSACSPMLPMVMICCQQVTGCGHVYGLSVMKSDPRVLRHCQTITSLAAIFVVLVGWAVLCGWIFHLEWLASFFSLNRTMKANTAICLIVAGGVLWLLRDEGASAGKQRARSALAVLLLLLGALLLIQSLGRWD